MAKIMVVEDDEQLNEGEPLTASTKDDSVSIFTHIHHGVLPASKGHKLRPYVL